MDPTLPHGTIVLVRSTRNVNPNDIVLCRHPFKRDTQIVKRVKECGEKGVFVVGDNPDQSTDSRSFGTIPWVRVVGVVTSKMRR